MRSVVVVLPASMCAMIPMFRVFSSENCLGISLYLLPGRGQKKGPSWRAPYALHRLPVGKLCVGGLQGRVAVTRGQSTEDEETDRETRGPEGREPTGDDSRGSAGS